MGSSVTVKLSVPVQWGKETIESLEIKPTARAFRDFSIPMTENGKIDYQPYQLAKVGLLCAGKVESIVDKLEVADMVKVAQVVLGFIGDGPKDGSEQSP